MSVKMSKVARELVRLRANGRCERCGAPETIKRFSIHHKKPRRDYPEEVNNINNCELLCKPCHKIADKENGG